MMQLRQALNSKGFSVTVAQGVFHHQVSFSEDFPEFHFVTIPKSLPESDFKNLGPVAESVRWPSRKPKGQEDELVPEFHPLRYKDFPVSRWASLESITELYRNIVDKRTASSVIINTASCLESSSLSRLQQERLEIPVYPVGPLHMMASAPTSLLKEDNSCITWLSKQKVNSVIYISLGSLALMEIIEVIEIASGLAACG
ncbi:unnamed protein product [Microthlaspi erraticum]|uniref:Uncharacterized protein n=1 Tax=Microthlaspi erraticum TaxID=1685480 RepID=A0A6D2HFE9_9BRAS|nr:unnamed protein product [Microthlaspi erraticum]